MSAHRTVEVASGNTLFKACLAHLMGTGIHNGLYNELKAYRAVGSVGEAAAVGDLAAYKVNRQEGTKQNW